MLHKTGEGGLVKQGLTLKEPVTDGYPDRKADVELELEVPATGWYILEAEAQPRDPEQLKKEDTTGLLTRLAYLQLGTARITKRIVYDSYKGGTQELGKFEFGKKKEKLKIWLPGNLVFYTITVKPYIPPVPPKDAEAYVPRVLPPASHPRLWVNNETLPVIRQRLQDTAHQSAWMKVRQAALHKFAFAYDPQREVSYNEKLEQAIESKAFYFLLEKDRMVGAEAVELMVHYLSMLEFGNITYGDISREMGRAIYTAALVYDWCYELLSIEQKTILRRHMQRLARDMEIGWPPFFGVESIVNGHGNEAQICRDLLAMSIAIYDEDPVPYKYTAYTVLEQLVPMRKFEYQSPRHNQGIDYGGYRFGWEMHAAWLFYRMTGFPVFDDNIKDLPYYWLYMRTPDGKMLRDGDMFSVKYAQSDSFYWKNPQTMLLSYAYSGNALFKGQFLRQGGLPDNPVLFLLLDDPALKPDFELNRLPRTLDFGPVLGSMVARTGWEEQKESGNVVAEIKGGGFHFGNHQHADAGAIQIYHHGMQVGDLGLYLSYGSPYDFNFNKRSVAHSMLLVQDPAEPLLFRTKTNDGGTRFSQRFPRTVAEVLNDSWFHTGFVRSCDYGPDPVAPSYSYFNADLTAAYSAKLEQYSRSFLFLDLKRPDVPAVIMLLDEVTSADPSFKKTWQINTLNRPQVAAGRFILSSSLKGRTGTTYVNMLVPAARDRKYQVLSGDSSAFVSGDLYSARSAWPEAKGSRILVSPLKETKQTTFVTVFQMAEETHAELPLQFTERAGYVQFQVADKLVVLARPGSLLQEAFTLEVPGDQEYEVIVAGLREGFWNLSGADGKLNFNAAVLKNKHTVSLKMKGGRLVLKPQRVYNAQEGILKNSTSLSGGLGQK
ncbi:DUF4962 domain-containing protein [Niabella pedocola]|uniref:DUF4962 domain-containing protein n=1 Tax=Niabella pedocola TaxID=1752077 RepID=A0ABS8PSH8_9BACT|nr:DUF4962 domain-containing protein [Niabella pedocola]MCD2424017.1 DUF4962 domain-containing protein [Niabella pedocola]